MIPYGRCKVVLSFVIRGINPLQWRECENKVVKTPGSSLLLHPLRQSDTYDAEIGNRIEKTPVEEYGGSFSFPNPVE